MQPRRSVLITGAAGGIGEACARRLVEQGSQVIALDRSAAALEERFGGEAAVGRYAGDVASPEDCAAAVDFAVTRTGHLDAIIHCAAVHSSTAWADLEFAELQHVLAVNVGGSFLIAQAGARHMQNNGGGAILLMSSSNVIAGGTGGSAGMGGPAYVASKSAIVGLVRSLARSLGPHQINVNGIMPGVTATPMTAGYSPEHRARQTSLSPLGRIAEPEDIADVSCFLISHGARHITGETVIVNGGAHFG